MPSCVLAYSGGLDTSVILGWLLDQGYQVHCLYVDLGQPCEDREATLEKALKTGATTSQIVDVREELCRDFAFPVLAWRAKYESIYLLGTSIARPLITKKCLEVARQKWAPRRSPTERRARATTSVASSWRPTRWPPTFRSSLPGGWRRSASGSPAAREMIAYCAGEADPGQSVGLEALQLGRELPAHQLRGGQAGGSDGQRRRHGGVRHDGLAAARARQDRAGHDRFRSRRAGQRQRPAAGAVSRSSNSSTRSAAATASAASTWSRTGLSA